MSKRKYIVKQDSFLGKPEMGKSIYMRCGPSDRNLVRIAVCPCSHAYSLARTLNRLHETTLGGFELVQGSPMSKRKPEFGEGIYTCRDASLSRGGNDQEFKACSFTDAAGQFAKLQWDMGTWKVDSVVVLDPNGRRRLVSVERVESFEGRLRR